MPPELHDIYRSEQDFNDLFEESIRQALNHYQDAAWLGKRSPLSSPYFLGSAFTEQTQTAGESAVLRGQILQRILFEAAVARVDDEVPTDRAQFMELVNQERADEGSKGGAYHLALLDIKYFRRIFGPQAYPKAKQEYDIREFLGVSRSTLFAHLKVARQELGEQLLKQLLPTVRLEQPPEPHGRLWGQETHIEAIMPRLEQQETVFLTGAGGCGKTSLAAVIAHRWPSASVFWFTFWPTLNDQLDSLLFSLGHFLNQRGASNLWGQLVTNGGHVDNTNLALIHLRTDLANLEESPLLCFDEVDNLLRNREMRSPAFEELITFLERLQGLAPILLMGQQPELMADHYVTLGGLTAAEAEALLVNHELRLETADQQQLHYMTGGNPRLLKLCIPLLKGDESKLEQLADAPSISALFASLWRSMPPQERALAQQLAVFRSPAPADVWTAYKDGLQLLHSHSLLQTDQQGGVRLTPIFTELIRHDSRKLSADQYERCHITAAAIRIERGEYTAGVYHLKEAGELEQAVQLWMVHRQHELTCGQGSVAYELLQTIPQRRLSSEGQQALALALGELSERLGKPQSGIDFLERAEWPAGEIRTIDALTLKGKFLNALGKRESALDTFEHNLQSISDLLLKQVHLYTWHGLIHFQQRNFTDAFDSARRAQYEAELFYGLVQEYQGKHDETFLAYQRALALSTSIHYGEGIAKANWRLATLLARQGQEAQALTHAQAAVEHFEQMHDLFNVERVRNTIIGIYFNSQRYDEAIRLGEHSLDFFKQAEMPYWLSLTAANLAEAYLETGNLPLAKARAYEVISLEEPQSLPYAYYTLGLVAKREADFPAAYTHLTEARDFAEQTADLYLQAYAERALGEVHLIQQQRDQARRCLQQALDMFTQLNNQPEIENTQKILATIEPTP